MLNPERNKKPVEEVRTTPLCRKDSDLAKSEGTAPVTQKEYKTTVKLFVKILVTVLLCETGIMILLHVVPLKDSWAIVVDPILLTLASTPLLYWLLVRPVWCSLRQRNRAVEALSKERNKAQEYLDIVGVILVIFDNAHRVTLINRKGSEILGRNEAEVLGRNWLDDFVPETDRIRWTEFLEQVMAEDVVPIEPFESWVLTKNCEERLISWRVTVLRDEGGNGAGILCSGEDITECRMIQQTLQYSEQRYRSFVQNFQGIVFEGYLNFVPVFFHGSVEEITGYRESEFVAGKPRWDQVIHPDDMDEISKIADELRSVPSFSHEREYRIIRKDRQVRWVHEMIQNVCDESGRPSLVQGALYDITERKQMEKDLRNYREHLEELIQARTAELTKANNQLLGEIARRKALETELRATNERLHEEIAEHKQTDQSLRETQERFRDFFENAPVGFHIFGPDRTIMDINEAELEMIGYTKDEIVGKRTWADLILPEQEADFEQHWREIAAKGQVRNLSYTVVHKDGHHITVLLNASARFDEQGRLVNTRGSVLDITKRRELERELLNIIERERQRTGQELHDSIGQQLTGIAFMVETLGGKLAGKSLTEEVGYTERIGTRVHEAVEQTRILARGLAPVDLENNGLRLALERLARNTEHVFGVSCSFDYAALTSVEDAPVAINLYRITQEAITNAIKHGKTKNVEIALTADNGHLKLTVKNDGSGFPAGRADGRGMGLKIMKHRAEMIDGSFDIHSLADGGTVITCVLSNTK